MVLTSVNSSRTTGCGSSTATINVSFRVVARRWLWPSQRHPESCAACRNVCLPCEQDGIKKHRLEKESTVLYGCILFYSWRLDLDFLSNTAMSSYLVNVQDNC